MTTSIEIPNIALPSIEQLVPHRASMLWLDGYDAERQQAWVRVKSDFVFATPQGWPSWVALEIMAQGIAAHNGWRQWQLGLPAEPGMLLQVKGLSSAEPWLAMGARLWVQILSCHQAANMGQYSVAVLNDHNQQLANAKLTVMEGLA